MSPAIFKHRTGEQAVRGKKSLVYGLGSTGLSVARYLKRTRSDAEFIDSRAAPPGLDDLRDLLPEANIVLGRPTDGFLDGFDRIIVSPGIADDDPLLSEVRRSGIEMLSDIDLFVDASRIPFAAVSGSNGKSTVATLLALMCEADGTRARAGANLGEPALDLLSHRDLEYCVLELSSFQLQRCKNLPAKVAVLLNISPDHLDWHKSEEDYRQAKYRIFRDATCAVWNRADPRVERHLRAGRRSLSFGMDEPAADEYGIVSRDGMEFLARGEQTLMPASNIALVGKHNQANALAALAAGELMGLALPAMLTVLYDFSGLPHRMQSIRLVAGVEYINDSKATNVGAAISAVESMDGSIVLIAGGQGKGGDFSALAEATHERLRAVVLIGEDAPAIGDAYEGRASVHMAGDMQDAVQRCASLARPGDVVLLAPACASFDQFDNFQVRGEAFCDAVKALGG